MLQDVIENQGSKIILRASRAPENNINIRISIVFH